uniref:Uncharacterized protein n=1 Tax=Vitis vinifera TaxID=29760 RepID=A5AP83_VITVI|nr:hypothetical protein VITISV_039152 [Vitis vinifera]
MNQTTINDAYKKEAKERTCMLVIRWMYEADIPFNAITYLSFQPMIEAIDQYGIGMKGPTLHEVSGPLVSVLCLVDGEKKTSMGYIYEAMDRVKDAIVRSLNGDEEKYKEIFKIIDKRWEIQLHRSLHIHSKKRNKLDHQHLNDLVYIKNNRALKRRYNEHDTIDPISLKDINDSNEWLIGRMEDENSHGGAQNDFVFDDDNLTWGDVAKAIGAKEAWFDTRARANSSIIPPPKGIASSFRTLPFRSLIK